MSNKGIFNNKGILKRLLSYMKPYSSLLVTAMVCAVVGVSMTLLAPVIIGNAIDYIIDKGNVDFNSVAKQMILLAVTIMIGAFAQWFMTYCTNKVTYRTVKDLREEAFAKLNSVPLKYTDTRAHGDIINSIINDIDTVSDGLLQGFASLLTGVITIVGTLGFMVAINPVIAIVVVALTPLSFFVATFISKRIFSKFREQSAIRGELTGYIEEMIGNQKLVTTYSGEEKICEEFSEINQRLNKVGVLAQFYSALTNPCTRFVNGLVYAAVGVIGAINVINLRLSVGQLSCFLSYANQYTKPFNEISGVVAELQSAFASAKRVFDIIDEEDEVSDEEAIPFDEEAKNINIDNISFSYVPEKPLIDGFSLDVNKGQKIAIVGPTGCGKTTFINLLMRFYDVNSGSIMINGTDIKDIKRADLRKQFGMVLQDTWLFSGTVRDNIAYGKEDATDEEIIEASKAAYAHSFIKRLKDGYNTVISEEGGNISTGQKQLLCIARIMLTKPPILILDEATSNIDTRTEVKIQKAFDKMMEGRTSFVVAHRLSTIREADVILVMDKGHIIEHGNHDELLKINGFYARLYRSQFAVVE